MVGSHSKVSDSHLTPKHSSPGTVLSDVYWKRARLSEGQKSVRAVCSATFSRMTITHKAGFKSPHSFHLFHVTAHSPNPTKQKKHLLIHVTGWGVTQRHELSNNVTCS